MLLVENLLRYMGAKNYQNIVWFDQIITKIKWCSFLTHMVYSRYCYECNRLSDYQQSHILE